MNLSRHPPPPTRYIGIGLVVALHLAGIYALSAGLIRPVASPPTITTLKPLPPDVVEPPPPVEPLRAAEPALVAPPVIQVPVPTVVVEAQQEAPPLSAVPLRTDPGPQSPTAPARTDGGPLAAMVQPEIRSAGAVCSVMPRPEVPAVNWSGEAVLQVLATVRGGRVVGSDFRVAQGVLDGKTRRSLQRSVESALAGYQCQGDATFQQDFAFQLD
jgi:periplasmic protein TonB